MADDALRPPPNIDFTARDWESNVAALKEFVRVREPERWNSFFEGDLGMVVLEMIAYDSTMLSYVLDAQTQECYIDTLRIRESALHFARLTSYQIRRATVASVEVYALSNQTPTSGNRFRIRKGRVVKDKLGQPWEVTKDYVVEAGKQTPVSLLVQYGDVKGKFVTSTGVVNEINALIKLEPNSSVATLVNEAGERLNSEVNFGPTIGAGHILRLQNEWLDPAFGAAPVPALDEYAIVEPGKFDFDIYGNAVLYLDRPWAGASNWIGKWRIESRNIILQQGEAKNESFTGPTEVADRRNFEVKGNFYPVAMGNIEQTIPSGYSGNRLLSGFSSGIEVTVNGVVWRETSSLLFEPPDSFAYEVDFDEKDRFVITFGNGVFGALIPVSAVVQAAYRVGGGATGNVTQNSFDTAFPIDSGTPGTPAQLYLTNSYTVGRGGQDRESLTEVKRNIPQHVRTNDRAVTVEDYAYLASNFADPTVGRIKLAKGVVHKNVVPREQNVVWVYAWVEGSNGQLTAPTLSLKSRLLEYLNERKMITDEVVIIDGITTPIPVELRYSFNKGADRVATGQKVQAAINFLFAGIRPGDTFHLSALYEAVESVSEVGYCQVLNPKTDVIPSNEFELFSNTLQLPAPARLVVKPFKGDLSVVVQDPSPFYEKGYLSIFESGSVPTTAIIADIQSNVITLRQDTPLQDTYSLEASVLNSEYYPLDWQFERKIDVFVSYDTGNGTQDVVTSTIARKVKRYFNEVLRPEEPLVRTRLELLVRSVTNVTTSEVFLRSLDNTDENVSPAQGEKIMLGTLSINGQTL